MSRGHPGWRFTIPRTERRLARDSASDGGRERGAMIGPWRARGVDEGCVLAFLAPELLESDVVCVGPILQGLGLTRILER